MNNLHRELAPITDEAWDEIGEEATRTFTRLLAGRRVVDVLGPSGYGLSAVGTGHTKELPAHADGVHVRQRQAQPLIELRVPFTVTREAVDDVERGAKDSDWQPVKDAAHQIAYAEDRALVNGYDAGQIEGIAPGSSNQPMSFPDDVRDMPDTVAQALSVLRLAGVDGPYSLLLPAEQYTKVAETTDHGYPVLDHVARLLGEGKVVWAPAVDGGLLVSTRGGDYELHLGQDLSIGYESHDSTHVELYLQESLTFFAYTSESSVVLTQP